MPDNERKDSDKCWNGGKTNEKKHLHILRQLEDKYDIEDSEIDTRKELRTRQEIMNKTKIKKPLHELYTNINYEKKTKISGIGGKGGPIDTIRTRNKND